MASDEEIDHTFHSFVDADEVNYKVIQDLNTIFGSDVSNLDKVVDLFKDLTERKELLEKKLRFASVDASDEVSKAVKAAEEALQSKDELDKSCKKLVKEVEKHKKKSSEILDLISSDVHQFQEVQRVEAYKRWLNSIADISNAIESSVKSRNDAVVITKYGELKDLVEALETSKCEHLKEYTIKTTIHWHAVLYEKFKSDYEAVLKTLKWPFTSKTASRQGASLQDNLSQLASLTKLLLQLTLPEFVSRSPHFKKEEKELSTPGIVADFPQLLLPLKILFRPFEIRFSYHFSGNKATNSRDNPEWYFTQCLQWIGLHDGFLDTWLQPVLNETNYKSTVANVEFMRTLVRLVMLKLSADLPEIEDDEDLFCRTIQETLNFERELRIGFGYPTYEPSVLSVLTQAHIFSRWVTIERKFALELMDEIVSREDAWYSVEEGETAQCGEQLILLLQGITDRYKPLPQPGHRIQFLELQLDLVDDFRVRALQLMKSEMSDPLTSNYAAILNTVAHVANTLKDWDSIPFFIEMQYYQEQFNTLQSKLTMNTTASSSSFNKLNYTSSSTADSSMEATFLTTIVQSQDIKSKQDALNSLNDTSDVPSSMQLTEVKGSVFEETNNLYLHIETDMTNTIANHLVTEVRARSQNYRKDKWFLSSQEGQPKLRVTEISPTFCMMLEILTKNLMSLRRVLKNSLFTNLWHKVSSMLDKFIYEEVILQNNFSEYGGSQLQHDMYQALFPIFGEYSNKPQNYFPFVKDSITLLNLPRPTAQLLRETLKLARDDQSSLALGISPVKALQEHKVNKLTPEEADVILNIRTNMAR